MLGAKTEFLQKIPSETYQNSLSQIGLEAGIQFKPADWYYVEARYSLPSKDYQINNQKVQ